MRIFFHFFRPLPALVAVLSAATGALGGDWPQFRGPNRDNISTETGILKAWPAEGPKVLWRTPMAQGYAGAAIRGGKVYVNDYNTAKKEHWVRCLNVADGKDVWGWSYPLDIRPNHGITRTVPAVGEKMVFSLDPKCRFHAIDAATGKLAWQKNLIQEYKAVIPQWYAGQCPLLDGDKVIIATGGDALAEAFDQATGKEVWRAPNPDKYDMSHASLMPAEIGGVRQYLYLTMKTVVGLCAEDGKILWSGPFKAKMAASPSPLLLSDGRVFVTCGYEAGSALYKVEKGAGGFSAEKLLDIKSAPPKFIPDTFNSEVHTPVIHQGHLFAVGNWKEEGGRGRGQFSCLGPDLKVLWRSPTTFGLGSFLLADGVFFILDGDSGMLRLVEAGTKEYKELAKAQVLHGEDVWGPMALSDGKLFLRDMKEMVCIEVGSPPAAK